MFPQNVNHTMFVLTTVIGAKFWSVIMRYLQESHKLNVKYGDIFPTLRMFYLLNYWENSETNHLWKQTPKDQHR